MDLFPRLETCDVPAFAQLLVILVAMVGFWAIVMRPARNQQRGRSSCSRAWRSATRSCSPRGSSAPIRSLDEATGRARGGPGRRAHGGAPGRRTTCGRARRRRPRRRPTRRRDPTAPTDDRGLRRTDDVAKKTPRPGRTLLIFGSAIVRALRPRRARRHLEAAAGARPRGRHPDHAVGDRPAASEVTETKLKQAAGIVDQPRQRQRCRRGRGLHPGQPQHHRRDPRRERLQPRRRGQAHRAAALPARRRRSRSPAQPQPQSPSESASPVTARPARPARPSPTPSRRRRRRPARPRPNPRPAPFADADALRRPAPPSPTARRSPARRPSRDRPKGALGRRPVAWAQNPGTEWLQKFAAFTCPEPRVPPRPRIDRRPGPAADRLRRGRTEVPAVQGARSRAPS